MKICVTLILLTILCPGGCPVYDFNLKTVEKPTDFSNELNLAAELNSEYEQDLVNLNTNKESTQVAGNTFKFDAQYDGTVSEAKPPQAEVANKDSTKLHREADVEGGRGASCPKIEHFVGSNLFDGNRKKCFSSEDMALLTARRDFEFLIPKDLPKCLLNDQMISILMNYFYGGNQVIQRMPDDASKRVVEKAYYDMLGGYLRSYMLPVTKYSFYAGQASLKTVNSVIALYQQCKSFLNTNGNGWKAPPLNILGELKGVHIEPIKISHASGGGGGGGGVGGGAGVPSSCTRLELLSKNCNADDNQMIVALPKLETESNDGSLSNIWLPFKKKHSFNLQSPKSTFIILKFYETVTRCYKSQSLCQDAYNHKFKQWISENLQMHLSDEQFYPGLGAILRIFEKLRRGRQAAYYDDEHADENGGGGGDQEEETNDGKVEGSLMNAEHMSKEYMQLQDAKQLKSRKICAKPKKPKCKPKPNPIAVDNYSEQRHYLKYICCLVALILFILLLVLCCACLSRRKRKPKQVKDKEKPPKKKRKRFKDLNKLCDRFLCKKKPPADEEIMVKPDSKSVIAPLRRSTTSTSSLACQPNVKCIPYGKRGTSDKSDAPIIETTSLDYSSSEPESKSKKKKGKQQKVVTIDEKKQGKSKSPSSSPSKKRSLLKINRTGSDSTSTDNPKKKFGLSRTKSDAKSSSETDSKKSGEKSRKSKESWETMYES